LTEKTKFFRKNLMPEATYKAVVIGGSAGSMDVLLQLFSYIPETFCLPIIIVTHLHPLDAGEMVRFFGQRTALKVREASDKEQIQAGYIYFPPADYHVLVEQDRTFSLSVDSKVNYARPSIDVLFESAAVAWDGDLVGIILTGANFDGAAGISAIKKYGGLTLAQDPLEASYAVMPQAAITTGNIDRILAVHEIGQFLQRLSENNQIKRKTNGP
jgi:two-component system, chemotaxis family, protein-glutamate methylesterase/glutaminase